ncbi:expressed unknown protein [Seminavis robusta]|uniref:Uncharacterized protein n=1 Tax=Seminavis robusta TaxID=568900 RepID=A0A9N8HX85_9STRA|nr:expressed unknown protein [Seminavis robusta]|eukprot:Sro2413_g326780.1 n/a (462) ;mRNA; r:10759-12307
MVQVTTRRQRANPLRHMCLRDGLASLGTCTLMVVLYASDATGPWLRQLRTAGNDNSGTVSPLLNRTNDSDISVTKASKVPPIELSYKKPSCIPPRSPHALQEFVVLGVNLAQYGYESGHEAGQVVTVSMDQPYLLYEDFDIADQLMASKRWMQSMHIPKPEAMFLLYKHELDAIIAKTSKAAPGISLERQEYRAILRLLPRKKSFVAKPTNRACSSGVWVVKYDSKEDKTLMGYGGSYLETPYDDKAIAKRLSGDLNRVDDNCGDWAMDQVKAGFVIEERFSAFDSDDKPAVEFKVFTIWGRVWLANWRRGNRRPGLVHRNGTVVEWTGKDTDSLPDWVNWDRVVEVAERLARHKDMYRVDVFVGLPSDHPALKSTSRAAQMAAVQIRVSETEFVPSTHLKDPALFEEASRLWKAGYKMGIHKLIPNDEVPKAFLEKGFLSEEDAEALAVDDHFAPIRVKN